MIVSTQKKARKVAVSFTRPANTTGSTAYDVVATATTNLTFADVVPDVGDAFNIVGVTLEIDGNAVIGSMAGFVLHLYDTAPTVIADNAAYNLPAGDRTKYLGNITLATPVDIGDTIWSQNATNFTGKCTSASKTIYGILVTVGGYTPVSASVQKVTIYTSAA